MTKLSKEDYDKYLEYLEAFQKLEQNEKNEFFNNTDLTSMQKVKFIVSELKSLKNKVDSNQDLLPKEEEKVQLYKGFFVGDVKTKMEEEIAETKRSELSKELNGYAAAQNGVQTKLFEEEEIKEIVNDLVGNGTLSHEQRLQEVRKKRGERMNEISSSNPPLQEQGELSQTSTGNEPQAEEQATQDLTSEASFLNEYDECVRLAKDWYDLLEESNEEFNKVNSSLHTFYSTNSELIAKLEKGEKDISGEDFTKLREDFNQLNNEFIQFENNYNTKMEASSVEQESYDNNSIEKVEGRFKEAKEKYKAFKEWNEKLDPVYKVKESELKIFKKEYEALEKAYNKNIKKIKETVKSNDVEVTRNTKAAYYEKKIDSKRTIFENHMHDVQEQVKNNLNERQKNIDNPEKFLKDIANKKELIQSYSEETSKLAETEKGFALSESDLQKLRSLTTQLDTLQEATKKIKDNVKMAQTEYNRYIDEYQKISKSFNDIHNKIERKIFKHEVEVENKLTRFEGLSIDQQRCILGDLHYHFPDRFPIPAKDGRAKDSGPLEIKDPKDAKIWANLVEKYQARDPLQDKTIQKGLEEAKERAAKNQEIGKLLQEQDVRAWDLLTYEEQQVILRDHGMIEDSLVGASSNNQLKSNNPEYNMWEGILQDVIKRNSELKEMNDSRRETLGRDFQNPKNRMALLKNESFIPEGLKMDEKDFREHKKAYDFHMCNGIMKILHENNYLKEESGRKVVDMEKVRENKNTLWKLFSPEQQAIIEDAGSAYIRGVPGPKLPVAFAREMHYMGVHKNEQYEVAHPEILDMDKNVKKGFDPKKASEREWSEAELAKLTRDELFKGLNDEDIKKYSEKTFKNDETKEHVSEMLKEELRVREEKRIETKAQEIFKELDEQGILLYSRSKFTDDPIKTRVSEMAKEPAKDIMLERTKKEDGLKLEAKEKAPERFKKLTNEEKEAILTQEKEILLGKDYEKQALLPLVKKEHEQQIEEQAKEQLALLTEEDKAGMLLNESSYSSPERSDVDQAVFKLVKEESDAVKKTQEDYKSRVEAEKAAYKARVEAQKKLPEQPKKLESPPSSSEGRWTNREEDRKNQQGGPSSPNLG